MFEKEAEEYIKEHTFFDEEYGVQSLDVISKTIFKDGAEFGYNKAMKEIECLKDCSNCKHWKYSTRSLSYYCDKTDRIDDCEKQYYRCEYWEH